MTTIAAFACLVLKVMDNFSGGRPSVLNTTKTLLKEDGWWGFYRGFGPRFLSMSLYGTTMIVTYELISTFSSHLCIEVTRTSCFHKNYSMFPISASSPGLRLTHCFAIYRSYS